MKNPVLLFILASCIAPFLPANAQESYLTYSHYKSIIEDTNSTTWNIKVVYYSEKQYHKKKGQIREVKEYVGGKLVLMRKWYAQWVDHRMLYNENGHLIKMIIGTPARSDSAVIDYIYKEDRIREIYFKDKYGIFKSVFEFDSLGRISVESFFDSTIMYSRKKTQYSSTDALNYIVTRESWRREHQGPDTIMCVTYDHNCHITMTHFYEPAPLYNISTSDARGRIIQNAFFDSAKSEGYASSFETIEYVEKPGKYGTLAQLVKVEFYTDDGKRISPVWIEYYYSDTLPEVR